MNFREEFGSFIVDKLTDEYVNIVRKEIKKLSNTDRKYIISIIGKYKEQESESTIKAIIYYAIWEPDNAIDEARKRGVFRYKGYGFKQNIALRIIESIQSRCLLLHFSNNTLKYLHDKKRLSWLYSFYKENEEKIVESIKRKHNTRRTFINEGYEYEYSLFKDLLAYIDLYFYRNVEIYAQPHLNKNHFEDYSKEEICEGISYIIFLYNLHIGIKQNINYIANPRFVLSAEIQELILRACKIIEVQEWELCIDYFDYNVNVSNNEWLISDKDGAFEKCIRLGFVRNQIQEVILYASSNKEIEDDALSIV